MKIEEIKELLASLRGNHSHTKHDIDKIMNVINQLEADKMEAYKAIVNGGCENGLIWKATKYLGERSERD